MDADDRVVELYKLEYEKGAERYDNIYRSIWTIFSYLTAVTAGILALGYEKFERHVLVCIAESPLIFWFWTTYLPLDRYGNEVLNRLAQIERLLNYNFHTTLDLFSGGRHTDKGLSLFKGLGQALKGKDVVWKRARFAIGVTFILMHAAFFWNLYRFYKSGQPLFQEKGAAAGTVPGVSGNVTVVGR